MKKILQTIAALALGCPVAANALPVVYDITLTGSGRSEGISGTGVATFADNAFDADGVFELDGALLDFHFEIEGVVLELADLVTGTGADYAVALGEISGFDWGVPAGDITMTLFDSRLGFAAPISMGVAYVNSSSSNANCFFLSPICELQQDWSRRPISVPEAGTLGLLGIGLAAVGFARRRKAP